ncbi:ABC transporter permease [Paenibacillus gansuensis]|uniref:ABC transporter permease n=1 Tax=Paenibacillus gansuensis TaxID=306542 RepID=A0ABW5PBT1_9BACL
MSDPTPKRMTKRNRFMRNSELTILSLPGVLYTLLFAYLPMIGIVIAFQDYRVDQGFLHSAWVGLDNFRFFFVTDYAWRIIRNTIGYNLTYMIINTTFALIFALLLNEIGKFFVKIYQTVLFLPYFLSSVLVSYITYAFLEHKHGYLNQFLLSIGMDPHKWYLESAPWIAILPTVALWQGVGFGTLIYYAGILGINHDYYEAARLDGANRFQMMTKITLPLLTPLIMILFIMGIGNIIRGDFGLHFFIPNNSTFTYSSTDIIDTYVYRALRQLGDVSMSAATGVLQSVVGLVMVVSANYLVRRFNEDNSLF